MFNRLIIAVLSIGFILTFCGTAFSDTDPVEPQVREDIRVNQSTGLFKEITLPYLTPPAEPIEPDIEITDKEFRSPPPFPTDIDTSGYYCQFYIDDPGTAFYFIWTRYGGDTRELAMKFDIPESHNAILDGVYAYIFEATSDFGGVDVIVTVYEDGGGVPGAEIYSESFPIGACPGPWWGYQWFGFTTPVEFSGEQNYHVGFRVGGSEDDYVIFLSDDGAHPGEGGTATPTGRGSCYDAGDAMWYSNMAYFGFDPNYDFAACQYVYYSSCYDLREIGTGWLGLWAVPDDDPGWPDGGVWNGASQRFVTEGRDTLIGIRFYTFDYTGYGLTFYPPGGTNEVEVSVWKDDAGSVDIASGPVYQYTIPGGLANLYPQTGGDGSGAGWNYVYVDVLSEQVVLVDGPFHLSGKMTSDDPADGQLLFPMSSVADNPGMSGASVNFSPPGNPWERTGVSNNWLMYGGGEEQSYYIRAYLCRDEFYNCQTQMLYNAGANGAYVLYPNGNWTALAGRVSAPSLNRIENVRVQLISPEIWGEPLPVNAKMLMSIYESGGTSFEGADAPGALIHSELIDTEDLLYMPLFNEMVVPADFFHAGDFYVGFEVVDHTVTDYFYNAHETVGDASEMINGGMVGYYFGVSDWINIFAQWGSTRNIVAEVDFCAIPIEERMCIGGEDWPTFGKNFARGSASLNSLGSDPQGNLTKAWQYDNPNLANLNSPVIYKDTIVCYFLDNLAAIDMNDGSEIWRRDADGFYIGSGCYATPTIFNFDAYGENVTLVFTPGGDSKAFTAINLTDGTNRWTRNVMDHSNHFMTWGISVIVDVGGTAVVIYNDDNGEIYAVDALAGTLFDAGVGGWTVNPVSGGGNTGRGVTSDGTNLYIGAGNDVLCLDAATGAENWNLSTTGGLQLGAVDAANAALTTESFPSGIAYDADYSEAPTLYFASAYNQYGAYPPYYGGGVLYSVNAANGALNWAVACNAGDYSGVLVDAATLIQVGWNGWMSGGADRGFACFSKGSGSGIWTGGNEEVNVNPGLGIQCLMEGMLSCEPDGAPDWFVVTNNSDFMTFHNANNGEQMFHRRFTLRTASGFAHHHSPVMDDGHMLIGYMDGLICLTNDAKGPRPRLSIPDYAPNVPVEFGSPDHFEVKWEGAFANDGGADLTIDSVILGDDDNGTTPSKAALGSVSLKRAENMERFADKFASMALEFWSEPLEDENLSEIVRSERQASRSNAAYVLPSWIYGLVSPVPGEIVSPGGAADIVVDIDGTQVPRGFTPMYAYLYTDDPDYFLDDARIDEPKNPYAVPQLLLGIVGGCLYDSVVVEFGVGQANFCYAWNAPKLAEGDIASSWEIDGAGASLWQGGLLFAGPQIGDEPPGKPAGIFSSRVAFFCPDWHSGQPNIFQSLLPDPGCFTGACEPVHTTGILLGDISHDQGGSYDPLYGELVTFAFVDSVADMCVYDTAGNCLRWDWRYWDNEGFTPPSSDTLTLGFHACGAIFAAYDEEALNNFVIHRYDVDGRYGPVNDVFFGAFIDYDIGPSTVHDVCGYDEEISTVWDYTCNTADEGWGMVKIPFGCNYEPVINAKTIAAMQAGWNDSDVWMDSIYNWMSTLTGLSHQVGTDPAVCAADPDDRDAFFTLAELDMPAAPDYITVGVAIFGMGGEENPLEDASDPATYAELAHTANKWCGFGRGDYNNDNVIDLVDIAYAIDYVYYSSNNGPYPFWYTGDVTLDGVIDGADVAALLDYYFNGGACFEGKWELSGDI